jgi:hypothetical protein
MISLKSGLFILVGLSVTAAFLYVLIKEGYIDPANKKVPLLSTYKDPGTYVNVTQPNASRGYSYSKQFNTEF